MPNWSYNNLTITGDPKDIKEFCDVSLKPNSNGQISFCFSNVFPIPEKIKNTISPSSSAKGKKWMNEGLSVVRNDKLTEILGDEEDNPDLIPVENNTPEKCEQLKKDYGADNWYDWNIKTYGTKWDIEVIEGDFTQSDDSFECSFDTAWSPPAVFLENLQNKFKTLDIKLTYELEGSDECGIFYTDRSDGDVYLASEQDEISYVGSDGRDIYCDENGDFRYHEDDEICEDYVSINPFHE